ncbi:hypothetical protein ABS71_10500 [bacterium SCN 62-11]|nr:MAG: hypothetical protein ABS71_10500 [bacterium SCN 62-11]
MNTTELNEAPVYAWSAQRELALLEAGYLTVRDFAAPEQATQLWAIAQAFLAKLDPAGSKLVALRRETSGGSYSDTYFFPSRLLETARSALTDQYTTNQHERSHSEPGGSAMSVAFHQLARDYPTLTPPVFSQKL